MKESVERTMRAYLLAFPRIGDPAVLRFLAFPYCYWAGGRLTPCPDPESFLRFRDAYMEKIDPQIVASEVLEIGIEPLGSHGALATLRSARKNRDGDTVSEGVTGFVLTRTGDDWRMTASLQGG